MTTPEPPTDPANSADPAAPLPPDLSAIEQLLATQAAGWQPPAALRAQILAAADRLRAGSTVLADRTRQRWWSGCAAAVLLIATLQCIASFGQPGKDYPESAATHRAQPGQTSTAPTARAAAPMLPWTAAAKQFPPLPPLRLVPFENARRSSPLFPWMRPSATPPPTPGDPS